MKSKELFHWCNKSSFKLHDVAGNFLCLKSRDVLLYFIIDSLNSLLIWSIICILEKHTKQEALSCEEIQASVFNLCLHAYSPIDYQVVLHASEVGLVTSQLVTSLGSEWDDVSFEHLTENMPGFRFSTFLTLLESRFLPNMEPAGLVEAVTAISHTFIKDVIKKVGDDFCYLVFLLFLLFPLSLFFSIPPFSQSN